MDRRSFLRLSLLAGAGLAVGGCVGGGSNGNSGTLSFANPLRVPPLLDPPTDADGVRRFALRAPTRSDRLHLRQAG